MTTGLCGVEVNDLCGVIYHLRPGEDEDGCPDRILRFSQRSTELSPADRSLLLELAEEMRVIDKLTKLEIESQGARGEPRTVVEHRGLRVVDALESMGVARDRLTVRVFLGEPWEAVVSFLPLECDGQPIW
jgi:hypothetical protein